MSSHDGGGIRSLRSSPFRAKPGRRALVQRKGKFYPGPTEHAGFVDAGSSHAFLIALVGKNRRVLEFGCGAGSMSRHLALAGCTVTGVELDSLAAADAREWCDDVIVADLDMQPLADVLPSKTFDVAIFGDVLEHLRDPWRVLDETRAYLASNGYVAISMPNVAHGALRLALLKGEFEYQELGLLDDTHLRFFTLKTVQELCLRSGFRVDRIERTKAPLFNGSDVVPHVRREEFDPALVAKIESDPDHDTLQFIVKAFPMDENGKFQYLLDQLSRARADIDALKAGPSAPVMNGSTNHVHANAEQLLAIDTMRAEFEAERLARSLVEREAAAMKVRLESAEAELEAQSASNAVREERYANLGAVSTAEIARLTAELDRLTVETDRFTAEAIRYEADRLGLAARLQELEADKLALVRDRALALEEAQTHADEMRAGMQVQIEAVERELATQRRERERHAQAARATATELVRRNERDVEALRRQIAEVDVAILQIHQTRIWKIKLKALAVRNLLQIVLRPLVRR